jgi:histidine phosphotransferase ChpT
MHPHPGVVDQLLSRLLHDLIGPASATANGVELLQEYGAKNNDPIAAEALDLISTSARQSADRLSYFRLAFGAAGNGSEHTVATVRALAGAYLASRKIALDFTSEADDGATPPEGLVKTVLAAVFVMADTLPRQGRVALEVGGPDGWTVSVTASGPGAQIDGGTLAGLNCSETSVPLNARTVIGVVAGATARRFGVAIETRGEPDLVRMTLVPMSGRE